MPKIQFTSKQLIMLTEIVENEAEEQRRYPCDDPYELVKINRLRDKLYKEMEKLNANKT